MPFLRHMEDDIRDLCDHLRSEQDEGKAVELAVRLRTALHEYIQETRNKIRLLTPDEAAVKKWSRAREKRRKSLAEITSLDQATTPQSDALK